MSITARELKEQMLRENEDCTTEEMMIEFAKIKSQEALAAAAEKVHYTTERDSFRNIKSVTINRESILNAYPETNIK